LEELTNRQLEILYQISDAHLEWLSLYSEYQPKYEGILKLNHQKMIDISDSCIDYTEDALNLLFDSILDNYLKMIEEYKVNL
jgi:hypothetical protein